MELAGKRILVTGGTRGIGAAVALNYAAQGARLVINSRAEDDAAKQTLDDARGLGATIDLVVADVAKPDEAANLIDLSVELMGGLDVMMHNAGGPAPGKLEDLTTEAWNAAFDVHVHAAFHLCKAATPHIRKNGEGAIILMSSAAGIRGCAGALVYGTVKGAIAHFTRMLARDLADDNIRVNCVAPGVIRTRFHDNMTAEQQQHNLKNRIPLHREGTCEQVAEAVSLLTTNDYMTGEVLSVDGGLTMQITR